MTTIEEKRREIAARLVRRRSPKRAKSFNRVINDGTGRRFIIIANAKRQQQLLRRDLHRTVLAKCHARRRGDQELAAAYSAIADKLVTALLDLETRINLWRASGQP